MKFIALIAVAALLTGCQSTADLHAKFAEFEKLGVTEVIITGKFSHTDYTVKRVNGVRHAEINHTNAWVPQIKIVRETPDSQ